MVEPKNEKLLPKKCGDVGEDEVEVDAELEEDIDCSRLVLD